MLDHPLAVPFISLVLGALLSFGVWIVKGTNATQAAVAELRSEVRLSIAELRVILVGTDGQNGLRSEVKSLRETRHVHGNTLHAHEGRLALHEEKHRRHDARLEDLEEEVAKRHDRHPRRPA